MGGYCAAVVVDAAGTAAMGAADVLVLVLVLVAFDVVAPLVRLPVVEEVLLVIPVSAGGAACSRSQLFLSVAAHCFRPSVKSGAEGEEAESEAFLAKPAATSTRAAAAAFSFMTTSTSGLCPDAGVLV